ncbi:hypothetical protein [Chlorobium sp.]|uniref:hypothetical protein n=1 Tax=Chlorobium sp. TaxID=1095 RepID=UPI003C354484
MSVNAEKKTAVGSHLKPLMGSCRDNGCGSAGSRKKKTMKNKAKEWIFLPIEPDFMFQPPPVCRFPHPFLPGMRV